jgi:hypothetical protein
MLRLYSTRANALRGARRAGINESLVKRYGVRWGFQMPKPKRREKDNFAELERVLARIDWPKELAVLGAGESDLADLNGELEGLDAAIGRELAALDFGDLES